MPTSSKRVPPNRTPVRIPHGRGRGKKEEQQEEEEDEENGGAGEEGGEEEQDDDDDDNDNDEGDEDDGEREQKEVALVEEEEEEKGNSGARLRISVTTKINRKLRSSFVPSGASTHPSPTLRTPEAILARCSGRAPDIRGICKKRTRTRNLESTGASRTSA